MGTETYTPPASGPTSETIEDEGFFRVERQAGSDGCGECGSGQLWTIAYTEPNGEEAELGQSWEGDDGRELAEDICGWMNMAFETGKLSATGSAS